MTAIPDTHIRNLATRQGWTDSTLLDITLNWICGDAGRYAKYIIAINSIATEEERLMADDDMFADENEEATETCRYCGGNCPNEPENSENLCDGFAGDVDGLYASSEDTPAN